MSDDVVRLDRTAEDIVRMGLAYAGVSGAPEDAKLTDLLPRPAQRDTFLQAARTQVLHETGYNVLFLALVVFDGETSVGNMIVEVQAFLAAPDNYLEAR